MAQWQWIGCGIFSFADQGLLLSRFFRQPWRRRMSLLRRFRESTAAALSGRRSFPAKAREKVARFAVSSRCSNAFRIKLCVCKVSLMHTALLTTARHSQLWVVSRDRCQSGCRCRRRRPVHPRLRLGLLHPRSLTGQVSRTQHGQLSRLY